MFNAIIRRKIVSNHLSINLKNGNLIYCYSLLELDY